MNVLNSKFTLLIASIFVFSLVSTLQAQNSSNKVKVYNSERRKIPLLSPEDALKTIEVPEGFKATVFAADPDLLQPISMTFDAKGRMWVCENYTYSERSLNFDTRLKDRILIFEDTDNDGRFDKKKVFWDQGRKLTSVEIGFGGVWAMCAPQLLFIPDADHDDVPDGEPEVILDGWNEGRVRHNIANGLKWGPDGWLYGRHGIMGDSLVGPPGMPKRARTLLNAAIWRFHPTEKSFEIVAQGTTNPWGHDWDKNGQLYFINTVIGHLWHVLPGANYERMYGNPFNPHLYELIPQTADHFHWDTKESWNYLKREGMSDSTDKAGGGHAHSGMMIYLGDNWPKEYHNDIFTVNYHGRRLNRERIERKGATYVGTHKPDMFKVGDIWFRGVEVTYGPDGGVYVADWSDVGECHDSDGVHRTSGRIYKYTYGTPKNPGAFDLRKKSPSELVTLQLHANEWWSRRARLVLQEMAAAGKDLSQVRDQMKRLFHHEKEIPKKLRLLWALHVTGGVEETFLGGLLRDSNENIRVWAIQLLIDKGVPSRAPMAELLALSKREKSGLVLSYLASSLQRLPLYTRLKIAEGLAKHSELAEDPVYPLILWYGIEEAVASDVKGAVRLASVTKIPKLWRFISRRILNDGTEKARPLFSSLLPLSSDSDALKILPKYQEEILQGALDAFAGRSRVDPPHAWKELERFLKLSASDKGKKLTQELSVFFGDGQALTSVLAIAKNGKASISARRRAIRSLVQAQAKEGLKPVLLSLLNSRELGVDAVQGLSIFNESSTWEKLLNSYGKLRPETQAAIIKVLSSRKESADVLLRSVASGVISQEHISAFYIRQMRSLGDESITARLDAFWPDLTPQPLSQAKQKLLEKYTKTYTKEKIAKGDAKKGKLLFQKNCGSCHKLFGEGGTAGPDLTGSNRQNLEYIFMNVVDPSSEVAESFQVSNVILNDGRILTGVLSAKSDRMLNIQLPEEVVPIEKNKILSIQKTEESLMPEGLLDLIPEPDRVHLLKYLTGF